MVCLCPRNEQQLALINAKPGVETEENKKARRESRALIGGAERRLEAVGQVNTVGAGRVGPCGF